MCGRFGQNKPEKLEQRYELVGQSSLSLIQKLQPRYNIAPSQEVAILNCDRKLELMKWGLEPFWGGEKNIIINARAESIFEKLTFKNEILQHRILVPATFFYEWLRKGEQKTPYLFATDQEIFSMAGLYSIKDGKPGFSIITVSANEVMAPIHDRMPVILKPEDEMRWLDPDLVETEHINDFLRPYPNKLTTMHQVSETVNSYKYDNPTLIERVEQ